MVYSRERSSSQVHREPRGKRVGARQRAGAPAGREVRFELLQEHGRVRTHPDAQTVGVEAGARLPAEAVDSTRSARALPQSRHQARQAPHAALLPRRSVTDGASHPLRTTHAGPRTGSTEALYTKFLRLKRYLHLFSSSVTLTPD